MRKLFLVAALFSMTTISQAGQDKQDPPKPDAPKQDPPAAKRPQVTKLTIEVADEAGKPVSGAQVEVTNNTREFDRTRPTGDDGIVVFSDTPRTSVHIVVLHEAYSSFRKTEALAEDDHKVKVALKKQP